MMSQFTQKQNNIRENANTTPAKFISLEQMTNYERNHPIYNNWNDWLEICRNYHSNDNLKRRININKGYRLNIAEENNSLYFAFADEIYHQVEYLMGILRYKMSRGKSIKDIIVEEFRRPICHGFMPYCSCEDVEIVFPVKNCEQALQHNQAHIISFIWAYVKTVGVSRSYRKYYKKLERVILSLTQERIINFDVDFIINPGKYKLYGRSLLKNIYERAYLDVISVPDMTSRFEYLKHFVKQQGGAPNQCRRDTIIEEMIQIAVKEFGVNQAEMPDLHLPKQQALFDVAGTMNHKFDTDSLEKMKVLIDEAQKDFFKGFQQCLYNSAKTIAVMFITAMIVALLTRIAIGVGAVIIYKLIHLICSFVCGSNDTDDIGTSLKQQSGEEIEDMPILPRLIVKYIFNPPKNLLGTIWNSRETDRIMKRISYLGDNKLNFGLERIMSWVKKIIFSTRSWFYQTFFGINVPEDLDGSDHAINTWLSEVDKIIDLYYDNSLVWTEATWSTIHNLYARGLVFTRSQAYAKYKNDVWRVVNRLGNLLEEFKRHNKDGASIRNPPVSLYLYGDTGVGKSALTYPLAVHMLKRIFVEERNPIDLRSHWKNLIYMRSAEQEYWDGYENQMVTLFDDFNQQLDSASNPSIELFEIIRASNCFPYPLHMASIEQKATTNFTSKIIIVSTNNKKPKTESLNFPAALQRRFDIAVEVRRDPNVKIEKGKFNEKAYQFFKYDMVTGASLGSMSFMELVDAAVIEYFARGSFVESIENYIDSTLAPDEVDEVVQDVVEQQEVVKQQGGHFLFEQTDGKSDEDQVYEAVLFKNAKSWYEKFYQDQANKSELGLFGRLCHRLKKWWNPNPIERLDFALQYLKKTVDERKSWFTALKQKYTFIDRMKIPLAMILAGLSFIGLYYGVKRIFHTKKKVMSVKDYVSPLKSKVRYEVGSGPIAEAYNPGKISVVKTEGYDPTMPKVAKVESYDPRIIKPVKVESSQKMEVVSQGVKDLSAAEILMKIARTNTYKMYIGKVAVGHIFFLRGKLAVMPKHYLYAFKKCLKDNADAVVSFESISLSRCFQVYLKDLLGYIGSYDSPSEDAGPVYSRDLAVCIIPTAIIHTDSVPYFVTKSSVSKVGYTKAVLPVLVKNDLSKSDKSVLVLRYVDGHSEVKQVSEIAVGDDEQPVLRYVRDVWEYKMDTQASECGAPLVVRNTNIQPGKICGFHIAGVEGTGQGYSTPFYQEDAIKIIEATDNKFTIQQSMTVDLEEFPKQPELPEDAEFVRLGALNKTIFQHSKTKIEPSLAFNKVREVLTRPCLLRRAKVNGEDFCPRKYRLNRLGNVPVVLDCSLVKASKEAFIDEMSSVFARYKDKVSVNLKPVYSFEEAVLGIDGEPYINSIKRDTSPGFPYVQNKVTRKDFFGDGEVYDLSLEKALSLRTRVNDIINKATENVALDHYFIDTLKDERKPIHKYYKTRLFSAGPIDYLIACKMYFNGIVGLISELRNRDHVSVGSNPYSEDWGDIARLLLRKSDKIIAGDFEGFDASQHILLLESAGEVLIELSKRFLGSTDLDCSVMRVLMSSLVASFHINGREVYRWTHSLPSGHYLTAIINSIFVNLAFGCVWQLALNEVSYATARSFWKECGIVAYGDDHVVSVPDQYLTVFNQGSLIGLFKQIGLGYTMEDKDAIVQSDARQLSEVSYLKRKFYFDKQADVWLAPLTLDTVLETPMWLHKCPDYTLQTIANLEWAMKELSLHSTQDWEKWSVVLRRNMEELGHFTTLVEQHHTRMVCLSQQLEM